MTPLPKLPSPKLHSYFVMVRPAAGADPVALKNTSWFTPGVAGEVVNTAVGGMPGATVTVCTEVAVAPRLSVTVSLTRKFPTVRNWCVVACPVALVPSPKSHAYTHSMLHATPLLVEVAALKLTVWSTSGAVGVKVKAATRFGFCGRMTPCGIRISSIWRANSSPNTPESVGNTAMLTDWDRCDSGDAGGAV